MPFTFSHPSITVPFLKLPYISATGLIIGSMGPDFEYFLRMDLQGTLGHSLIGLVVFNLPVCLGLAFLFHDIVKSSLIPNLPSGLQQRFQSVLDFHWNEYFRKHWWVVCYCIILGAASHILWDAITHRDGFFVEHLPSLKNLMPFAGKKYPYYHMMQHASSVLGLIILGFVIYKLPRQQGTSFRPSMAYWLPVAVVTVVVSLVRLSMMDHEIKIGHVIVVGLAAFMLGIVLTGIFNVVKPRASNDPDKYH